MPPSNIVANSSYIGNPKFNRQLIKNPFAPQMVLTSGNLAEIRNENEAISTRSLISKLPNPAVRNNYTYQTGPPDNA